MSLFARLLLGFFLAVVATIAAQAVFYAADPDSRLAPRLLLARGRLVREQGESALLAWRREGKSAAIDRLTALDETGLDAWIVTPTEALGRSPIPPDILAAARIRLTGKSDDRALGIWSHPLREPNSLLVIGLPRNPRSVQIIRLLLLVLTPALVCFALSRWLSAPIAKLHHASAGLERGDLSARVGDLNGYREARDLAHTFDAMADRLQRMVEAQRRMLADVSHEIRSPLARIRLASEMARRGEVGKNLDRIDRDIARIDELVEAISTLVKTDHEAIARESLDLQSLVTEVLDAIDAAHPGRIEAHLEPLNLVGDRRLLRSAIENVVQNALTYSPSDRQIEVRLTSVPPTFQVRDFGPGVPASDLTRIFEPFYRVSSSRARNSGGSGLGLAIVARAAGLHGAKIGAENHPEGGLVVRIEFLHSGQLRP